MEDFTDEMQIQQNKEVDELCGCPGKEKTFSRRIKSIYHEKWCFYYMHCQDKYQEALLKWKENLE